MGAGGLLARFGLRAPRPCSRGGGLMGAIRTRNVVGTAAKMTLQRGQTCVPSETFTGPQAPHSTCTLATILPFVGRWKTLRNSCPEYILQFPILGYIQCIRYFQRAKINKQKPPRSYDRGGLPVIGFILF